VRPRHARNGGAITPLSGTVREWQAPQRPQLVVARRRTDVLGALHARRQIGAAQYEAGREYQMLAETAGPCAHLETRIWVKPRAVRFSSYARGDACPARL
jgi:hypothetical protein